MDAGLIGPKMLQMQSSMLRGKLSDPLSFVPPSTIHTEPEGITSHLVVEMSQHLQRSLAVSLFGSGSYQLKVKRQLNKFLSRAGFRSKGNL